MTTRTLTFSPKQYAAHLRKLAAGGVEAALKRGCVSGAARCVPIVQRSVETAPPANPAGVGTGGAFNTGQYKRAWKSAPIPNGAVVSNDQKYAVIVEEGRRPGAAMPPDSAIRPWIQRRLGLSDKEAASLSFVIRRAISRRGLLPRKVLQRALPEMDEAVLSEIIRELEAAS